MLRACLRRVAERARANGVLEQPLSSPAFVDPDVMILLANDLLEIGGVVGGPDGKIHYYLTQKARALLDMKLTRASYVRHGDAWTAGPCWTDNLRNEKERARH